MPLEYQHLPVNIGGIDTKTDDKQLQVGQFVTAENVVMQKSGKIQNRNGYKFSATPLTHASEVIGAIAYDAGNIAIERSGRYYFDELNSNNVVNSTTYLETISFESAKFASSINITNMRNYSFSTSESKCCYAYIFGTGGNYYIQWGYYDRASNVLLAEDPTFTLPTTPGFFVGLSTVPPVSTGGTTFFYATSTDTKINFYERGVISPQPWVTGSGSRFLLLDAASTASYYAVLGQNIANEIILGIQNRTTKVWTTVSVATVAITALSVSIDATSSRVTVAYNITATGAIVLKMYSIPSWNLDYDFSYAYGGVVTKLNVSRNTNGSISVVLAQSTSATDKITSVILLNDGITTPIYTKLDLYDCELVSKYARPYFIVRNKGSYSNAAYFIYELEISVSSFFYIKNRAVASYCYAESVPEQDASIFVSNNSLIEFNDLIFPFIKYNPKNFLGTNYSLIFGSMKGNKTSNSAQSLSWNGVTITNAWGTLKTIDTKVSTLPLWTNFPIAAQAPTLTQGVTGGAAALGTGTYTYVLVFTSYDIQNNAYYSSPLNVATTTFAAGTTNTATLAIYKQEIFLPYVRYSIDIYRTEVDGDVFYFVGSFTGVTSYVDAMTDATLITNKTLYTTGGLVESAPAPIAKSISIAKNRMWLVTAESNELLYFSKKQYPKEAPQFNAFFVVKVPSLGGDLVHCAEMDDKVIIFRQNAIYATFGEGPDETGNGSFVDPQLVTQSMGCKYAASVVLTDQGLMFMSYEGIWLLSRGLSLQYIGAPVEQNNSLIITGALNLIDRHQIWFTSYSGTTLVWDDFHARWYTFTKQPTYSMFLSNIGTPVYYKTLAAETNPGKMLIEDATKYYDGDVTGVIPITLETGWISLAGVQNFQRLKKLTWLGKLSDTITIKSYFNFTATLDETFTVTTTIAGTSPAQYQVVPKSQKCESMKWNFAIGSLSGAFEMSSFGIEAGIKRGTFKLAQTKRAQGV